MTKAKELRLTNKGAKKLAKFASREARALGRQDVRRVAFEKGIDPNSAVSGLTSMASGLVSSFVPGFKLPADTSYSPPSQSVPGYAGGTFNPAIEGEAGGEKSKLLMLAAAGVGIFLYFKYKK